MKVNIKKSVLKQLAKAPYGVVAAFDAWLEQVSQAGLEETRLCRGFHDEPLQGQRQGQRSVRLNRQWRMIYIVDNNILTLTVLEVTPHDYRTR